MQLRSFHLSFPTSASSGTRRNTRIGSKESVWKHRARIGRFADPTARYLPEIINAAFPLQRHRKAASPKEEIIDGAIVVRALPACPAFTVKSSERFPDNFPTIIRSVRVARAGKPRGAARLSRRSRQWSNESSGNAGCLVITFLTDRCSKTSRLALANLS